MRPVVTGTDGSDEAIFDEIYGALRRYAASICSTSDDPDDLVQEAVSRVLRQGPLSDLDNPKAYLRRTISNVAINNIRADSIGRDRLRLVATAEEGADIYPSDLDVLDRLTTIERALLLLVDVEGCSFGEAARTVGLTPVAARLRASRARRRLKIFLGEIE